MNSLLCEILCAYVVNEDASSREQRKKNGNLKFNSNMTTLFPEPRKGGDIRDRVRVLPPSRALADKSDGVPA